jgi:hypothetical protein
MNFNWGYAYANGFVVLAEGLGMFTPRDIAATGRMNPSDIRITLVGWIFGTLCFMTEIS